MAVTSRSLEVAVPDTVLVQDEVRDVFAAQLQLSPEQLVASRETLRDYGNMSSATVLFVLKHILDQPSADAEERFCGMAFGPVLTVESALMTKVDGSVGRLTTADAGA